MAVNPFTMQPTDNPFFQPQNLLQMAGAVLQGDNFAQGAGNALATLGQNVEVAQEKAKTKQEENVTRAALQKLYPNEDLSALKGPELQSLLVETQKRKMFPQPKYMTVDGKIIKLDETTGENSVVGDYSGPKKPNLIETRNSIYDVDNKQWITPPAGFSTDSTTYGKQPIWFRDQDGKMKLGVPGDDGSLKILETPEGFEPLPGVSNVDLGTTNIARNNKTGETVVSTEKDVAGVEEQKVLGKDKGEIKAALPSARFTARVVSDEIKAIIDDPALPQALGPVESRLPTMREATARVESRIKKLAGQSFLQAREMLRGGGQITDFEGKKAEEAMARLDRAQSVEDFKAALMEFDAAVAEGIRKLEAAANGADYQPSDGTDSEMNTTTTGRKWKVLGQ